MKIDFEKVYFDDQRNFLLFKSVPEKYYLLRMMDFTGGKRYGNALALTQDIPEQCCVICEYLITKDEFDMWETDVEELRILADTLGFGCPADRVLKMYYQISPKSAPVQLNPVLGPVTGSEPNLVESMKQDLKEVDDAMGESFKDFLNGKNDKEIYFIHSNHLNRIFPAIDFEGKMFFVEGKAEADKLLEATKMFGNKCYQVDSDTAMSIIKNCKKYGIFKIVYCQADGQAKVFDRDLLLGKPTEDKWETYNSAVYNGIIRSIECGGIQNPQVQANQLTLISQLSHQIFKSTFLVPLGDTEKQEKTVILSRNAEALYNENNFVFYGAEDYTYKPLNANMFTAGTLLNRTDQSRAVPLCTDMEEFRTVFGENITPIAVTLEEAYSVLNDECKVIIFNPGTLGFVFAQPAMEQLREFSKKPVTVFRPEPEKTEEPEEKPTTVSMPAIPQPSSTMDIMHMVANQINKDEASKKEQMITSFAKNDDDNTADDNTSATEATESDTETEALTDESVETTEETTPNTAENTDDTANNDNESKEETTKKKTGFFSRFRKK